MPNDAVANLAKPGEVDEEPLFEEARAWVIEIRRLAKSHSRSMISGASGADEKKFGTSPNRPATSRWKSVCPLEVEDMEK